MLRLLSIYSGILPIILFFLFLSRNKKDGLWVIFFYVVVSFLTDLSAVLFHISKNLSFFILSLFTVLEYSFFTIFIYTNLKNKIFKKVLLSVSFFFLSFCAFSYLSDKTYHFIDSLPASFESIFILIFCILYFYEQLSNPNVSFIYSSKKFWIVASFLIYFSGTLFLFIYTSNLSREEQLFYWSINLFFNTLKNLILSLAFYLPIVHSQSYIKDNFYGKPPLTHFKP